MERSFCSTLISKTGDKIASSCVHDNGKHEFHLLSLVSVSPSIISAWMLMSGFFG